jgi:hypothetical protein
MDDVFSAVRDVNDPDLHLISTIYDEDSYVTIVEGSIASFDILSGSLDTVHLRRFDKNQNLWADVVTFRPQPESSVIDTPAGPYRRSKLQASNVGDCPIRVSSSDKLEATIYFQNHGSVAKTLECDELAKVSDSPPKKVWCQLGSLNEKMVLQLCLIPSISQSNGTETSYEIEQAFFSQPMPSK